MSKRKSRKLPKKVIFMAALLVVAGAGIAYALNRDANDALDTVDAPGTTKIDLSPPTEEEQQAGDERKEEIIDEQEQAANQPPDGAKTANISVVDASYYPIDKVFEMRAFVSNVYESGGTCKVTLKKGNLTVTKESSGFKDATSTSCTPISIPRSEFASAGDWSVTVSYSSSTASGSVSAKNVRIE